MLAKMKLILVRHGETNWNVAQRYQGQSNVPLNNVGQWQAQQVAQTLAKQSIEQVISSDLQRAQATARPIAVIHHTPIQFDSRWRELNFGTWEGLTYAEIMARNADYFQQWVENPMEVAPPAGETLTSYSQRVASAWQQIEQSKARTIVLVAHSGSLQLLLCYLLHLPPTAHWQFKLDHASLSYLQIYPTGAKLVTLNNTQHLRADAQQC